MRHTVLTLTQPWATMVAWKLKGIETRSWPTRHVGALLIHAGANLGPAGGRRGLARICQQSPFREAFYETDLWCGVVNIDKLPRGAIIARARLVRCTPLTTWRGKAYWWNEDIRAWVRVSDRERAFGDFSEGRQGFHLADIEALPTPIPAKGALGLWHWNGELP